MSASENESWQGGSNDESPSEEYSSEIEAAEEALREQALFISKDCLPTLPLQTPWMRKGEDDDECSFSSDFSDFSDFPEPDDECPCGSNKLFSECNDAHTVGTQLLVFALLYTFVWLHLRAFYSERASCVL